MVLLVNLAAKEAHNLLLVEFPRAVGYPEARLQEDIPHLKRPQVSLIPATENTSPKKVNNGLGLTSACFGVDVAGTSVYLFKNRLGSFWEAF